MIGVKLVCAEDEDAWLGLKVIFLEPMYEQVVHQKFWCCAPKIDFPPNFRTTLSYPRPGLCCALDRSASMPPK